jgi:hypothetical protein
VNSNKPGVREPYGKLGCVIVRSDIMLPGGIGLW